MPTLLLFFPTPVRFILLLSLLQPESLLLLLQPESLLLLLQPESLLLWL